MGSVPPGFLGPVQLPADTGPRGRQPILPKARSRKGTESYHVKRTFFFKIAALWEPLDATFFPMPYVQILNFPGCKCQENTLSLLENSPAFFSFFLLITSWHFKDSLAAETSVKC